MILMLYLLILKCNRFGVDTWESAGYSQSVDPNQYDTGTGLTATPVGAWTIQTIFYYAPLDSYDYNVDVQYGQERLRPCLSQT